MKLRISRWNFVWSFRVTCIALGMSERDADVVFLSLPRYILEAIDTLD